MSVGGDQTARVEDIPSVRSDASLAHRIRSVLAIRPFRRLWGVSFICSTGDWLSLLALTGLITKLTDDYAFQNYAFAGVVLTQLLPGLLFAPFGGLLADKFDRRKVMVACDVMRGGLLISIAVVGTPVWLLIANFLVGCCQLLWIPSKDAAVPNLLRRKDQVETANQLALVMTWGISVIAGAGLYALITGISSQVFHVKLDDTGMGMATIIVAINGLFYLTSAVIVATRIPELSIRVATPPKKPDTPDDEPPKDNTGLWAMLRDGLRFIRSTRLVRGLLIGMTGAFAAAGALVGSSKPYSSSLLGGDSAFGWLFAALFIGLGTGMASATKMASRIPHNRLFGISIVLAGLGLLPTAASPHLWVSLIAVAFVGACAGIAFLTGVTIIGTQVEDAIRGRINAIYQSLMKIILALSMIMVPLFIGLVRPRNVEIFGTAVRIDGTRPVLFVAGLIAALVGVIAYRQMDDRRAETILADLKAAIRGKPRRSTGLLIAIEGDTAQDTASQSRLLTDFLRKSGNREILLATDPTLNDRRLRAVLAGAELTGARAHALVAAAVRADIVEREIRPALDRGAIVVMERFVDSPFAHLSAVAGLDPEEMEGLTDWATAKLRPDLTVLLDRDPATLPPTTYQSNDHHWRVQDLLLEMASSDPDRYVVVDSDDDDQATSQRVQMAVLGAIAARKLGLDEADDRTPVEAQ
ncbi:MFS transporter [Kibdelosporangium philippinense]|uniref:Thymidylate kinase n=1 Tax=Kibdelosporangium philippinense TaxID=211113 RepID=A0ABS8ZNH9_9PSEU|nr:MFS transporter [Kibdelosporangium philippinense]MCE7009284.1 MFS transporter [Kibdelosporangium philippinense]